MDIIVEKYAIHPIDVDFKTEKEFLVADANNEHFYTGQGISFKDLPVVLFFRKKTGTRHVEFIDLIYKYKGTWDQEIVDKILFNLRHKSELELPFLNFDLKEFPMDSPELKTSLEKMTESPTNLSTFLNTLTSSPPPKKVKFYPIIFLHPSDSLDPNLQPEDTHSSERYILHLLDHYLKGNYTFFHDGSLNEMEEDPMKFTLRWTKDRGFFPSLVYIHTQLTENSFPINPLEYRTRYFLEVLRGLPKKHDQGIFIPNFNLSEGTRLKDNIIHSLSGLGKITYVKIDPSIHALNKQFFELVGQLMSRIEMGLATDPQNELWISFLDRLNTLYHDIELALIKNKEKKSLTEKELSIF